MLVFSGELGFTGSDDEKGGWTKALCIALGVNLERLRAEEAELMSMCCARVCVCVYVCRVCVPSACLLCVFIFLQAAFVFFCFHGCVLYP